MNRLVKVFFASFFACVFIGVVFLALLTAFGLLLGGGKEALDNGLALTGALVGASLMGAFCTTLEHSI